MQAEQLYMSHALLALPADQALPANPQPLYDGPTDQLDDAWSTYVEGSKAGEIAGLGALSLELPWQLYRMTTIVGGRRLYYNTSALSPTESAVFAETASAFEACAHEGSEPFAVAVEIPRNELNRFLYSSQRLLITNLELIYDPADQWYCSKPGEISVFLPGGKRTLLENGETLESLAAQVVNLGQKWGPLRRDPGQTYRDMLARYGAIEGISPKTKLPFLSTDVPVKWALVALSLLSLGLAAWVSHILWCHSQDTENNDEGFWLGLSSLSRVRQGGAHRLIGGIEVATAVPAAIILILSPVAMAVLTLLDSWTEAGFWSRGPLVILCLACLILSFSSVDSYFRIVRRKMNSSDNA